MATFEIEVNGTDEQWLVDCLSEPHKCLGSKDLQGIKFKLESFKYLDVWLKTLPIDTNQPYEARDLPDTDLYLVATISTDASLDQLVEILEKTESGAIWEG